MTDRLRSPETERALLAAIMIRPSHMTTLDIPPDLFGIPGYRYTWLAMRSLYEDRQALSEVSVTARLRRMGKLDDVDVEGAWGEVGVGLLATSLPAYDDQAVQDYVSTLEDCLLRRQLADTGKKLQLLALHDDRTAEELVEEGRQALEGVSQAAGTRQTDDLTSVLGRVWPIPDRGSTGLPGLRTGIRVLDEATGGMRRGHCWGIGGRKGRGKSSFGLQCALLSAKAGQKTGYMNLEMRSEEQAVRLLAHEARVDNGAIQKGRLTHRDREILEAAYQRLIGLPLRLECKGSMTARSIVSWARRHRFEFVVVDHLDLIEGAEMDPAVIPEASKAMKGLALQGAEPTVFLLRQLNRYKLRQGGEEKDPDAEDMRMGGGNEMDLVAFLHPDKDSPRRVHLLVKENRHGPRDLRIPLTWEPEFYRFTEG